MKREWLHDKELVALPVPTGDTAVKAWAQIYNRAIKERDAARKELTVLRPGYTTTLAQNASLEVINATLRAERDALREACEDIAGFINSAGHDAASLTEKFQSRARAALARCKT